MRLVATGILLGLGLAACSGVAAEDTTTTVQETTTTAVQETTTTTQQETTTTAFSGPVLTVTFDGENCTYEGPGEFAEGEVEIVNHNEGSEASWFWFGQLDEGRTTQEVLDYAEANPGDGSPSFTRTAVMRSNIAGGASFEAIRFFSSGLHNVFCGKEKDDIARFGDEFTVTP
jgi:hypothetical protein